MSKNGNGITAEQMIAAIKQAEGFVSKAADILGIGRTTFYRYLEKFVTAKEALEDVREARHDLVENKMMEQIRKGNTAMIIFYLKTQAKDRGYVERIQQELSGSVETRITVNWDDDNVPD